MSNVYPLRARPSALRSVIPRCSRIAFRDVQSLDKTLATTMTAITPSQDRTGDREVLRLVTLSYLDPPLGYRITGEGSGAVAFGRGSALVRLEEDSDGTFFIMR